MNSSLDKRYVEENAVKNIAVIVVLLISIPFIGDSINRIESENIEGIMGLFGLLLVYSGAVNFTFSYESINFKIIAYRYLAHATTFLAQLIMSMLLTAVYFLIKKTYPYLASFTLIVSVLSVISMIMFDFLDFYKNKEMRKE